MENRGKASYRKVRAVKTTANSQQMGLTDSEQPVSEWLTGNQNLNFQQRVNLLNEVCAAFNNGTAAAFQHTHRPSEFYITSNSTKASRSLNPVPTDLAVLKLAALLIGNENSQTPFMLNVNEPPGSNAFLEAVNAFQLTRVGALLLAEVLIGFLNAKGSLYLNELSISIQEHMQTFVLATSGKLPVCEHGLIRFHVETDGVSCRADVTPKAIALYAGMAHQVSNAALQMPASLQLIGPEDILPVKLQLNNASQAIFNAMESTLRGGCVDQTVTTLLHGPSGTGKTEFALQLAKSANVPILRLEVPQIRSKWVGETEKLATEAFRAYKDMCKQSGRLAILFMNEADGLLGPRVSIEKGSDLHANQIQNVFLQLLEDFEGVLIATTNYPQNIDGAFKRRFLFWHQLEAPSPQVIEQHLQQQVANRKLPVEFLDALPLHAITLAQLNRLEQQYQLLKAHCSIDQITQLVQLELQPNSRSTIGYKRNFS